MPDLELAVIASCDTALAVRTQTECPTLATRLRNMRLHTMRTCEIPHFHQRILTRRQQILLLRLLVFRHINRLIRMRTRAPPHPRLQKLQASNLILMPSQPKLSRLAQQIPHNDIRIATPTRQPRAFPIKPQQRHRTLVAIEAHDNLPAQRIPDPDRTVCVFSSEEIGLSSALRQTCHCTTIVGVVPAGQLRARLDVPAQHILVCANICSARAGSGAGGEG